MSTNKKLNILLLTNRDSDNMGDHAIELCDISLIHAAMQNLGFKRSQYRINSRAAGMVTKKYIDHRDPKDLIDAERTIQSCDLVVLGGAPLFNFQLQIFSERTTVIFELAKRYSKPVLCSAIGIEEYDDADPKCRQLKSILQNGTVCQITTRDGYDLLKRFVEGTEIPIAKVADPATFSDVVYAPFLKPRPNRKKKKIGIFILRATGFMTNGYGLTRESAVDFWLELFRKLEAKGYDYQLLTSGHSSDEAFLEHLIASFHVPDSKCLTNINLPEELPAYIAQYDAVISTRLHPSILSYSLGVPSLGLVWNKKVTAFYENIGVPERAINVMETTPVSIVEKLGGIIGQPVVKEPDYLMTVYTTMFEGIKGVFAPESDAVPYSYAALLAALPPYEGTSDAEQRLFLKRKFRRMYRLFNVTVEERDGMKKTLAENRQTIKEAKDKLKEAKAELKQLKKERANQPLRRIRRFLSRIVKKLLGKS